MFFYAKIDALSTVRSLGNLALEEAAPSEGIYRGSAPVAEQPMPVTLEPQQATIEHPPLSGVESRCRGTPGRRSLRAPAVEVPHSGSGEGCSCEGSSREDRRFC